MQGINSDFFITDNYLFVKRNKLLIKYSLSHELIDFKSTEYQIIRIFNDFVYLYNGSEIYKASNFYDTDSYYKIFEEKNIKDFYIFNDIIFFIHEKNNLIFFREFEITSYCWSEKFLFFSNKNGLFKIDLITNFKSVITDIPVDLIYTVGDILIYTKSNKIYINTPSVKRTVHKHDFKITNMILNDNLLYIYTEDNKLSILNIYKDHIRYINEYSSTNIKMCVYNNCVYILNDVELIIYDIETGEDKIFYNVPNICKSKLVSEEIENIHSVIVEPVYFNNDLYDSIVIYKNIIFLLSNDDLCCVYRFDKVLSIFYTGKSICAVFRNRIEVYRFINKKLMFIRRLKSTKQKIDNILEENELFYFICGNKLIKNDLINIIIDESYK